MSLSEEARWVRWSRSMNCWTCSPPSAGSQRTMGSLAMFSEENKIIKLWSSRRLVNTWIWFTDFILTSISIWTKAAQTNAVAANNMPTVILFKGLEHKTIFIIHCLLITLSAVMPVMRSNSYLKLKPHFLMRGKIIRSMMGTRVRIRMGFTVWRGRERFQSSYMRYRFVLPFHTLSKVWGTFESSPDFPPK